jgi:hypothetical protein
MSIFSKVAMPKPQHNTFDLSHDRKFSAKMGELIPTCVLECVPGDSFNIKASNMLRFAPLLAPVMHQSSVYTHFFFVPNRILWSNWENFITGGEDGLYPGDATTFPTLTPITSQVNTGGLLDYLGLPSSQAPVSPSVTPVDTVWATTKVSAFPSAAYNKIYNDYYRDENLITTKLNDTLIDGTNPTIGLMEIQKRAWQHDYFTSALPWTQRGPEATLPLGTTAPIIWENDPAQATYIKDNTTGNTIGAFTFDSASALNTNSSGALGATIPTQTYLDVDNSSHLSANLSGATAASINELRRAFRLQEWLERNARGGARYIEVIMAHFGVQSSDSRLQRPEFLGGSATPVQISEVLQTSNPASTPSGTELTPQANMAGHGVSVGSSKFLSYKCEEHGYIIGIMSIMPKSAYQNGIPKHFSKFDKFDYFWPSFANIGEQAITNQELFMYEADGDNMETFGYTPRYAEYKYIPSSVHGTFRSSLDFWHMGRNFSGRPALNQAFIEMDESEIDRIFAVLDPPETENLYVYLHNNIKARRPMPYFGTPTI